MKKNDYGWDHVSTVSQSWKSEIVILLYNDIFVTNSHCNPVVAIVLTACSNFIGKS